MKITDTLWSMITDGVAKVQVINRRYARPRLAMSPTVKVSLLILRLYLLVLVGLLGYKFATLVM